jgi:amino acid transporter
MAREGHLPSAFGRTNGHRAPWVSVVTIAGVAIVFVWYKPLTDVNFYYNTVVVTLALAYMSALAAFTRVMFARNPVWRAALASVLPMLAFAVLGYLMYSAGIAPADPKDLYQAWYIGAGVLASSLLIVIFGKREKQVDALVDQWVSKTQ